MEILGKISVDHGRDRETRSSPFEGLMDEEEEEKRGFDRRPSILTPTYELKRENLFTQRSSCFPTFPRENVKGKKEKEEKETDFLATGSDGARASGRRGCSHARIDYFRAAGYF